MMTYSVKIFTPDDIFGRSAIYSFRFRENERLLEKERFPDQLMCDKFDDKAIHVVFFENEEIKACVRALPCDVIDSPVNQMLENFNDDISMYIQPGVKYCMTGSFLIAKEYRKTAVKDILLGTLYKYLKENGYDMEILTASEKVGAYYAAKYKGITFHNEKPYQCTSQICPSPKEPHYVLTREIDLAHHPVPQDDLKNAIKSPTEKVPTTSPIKFFTSVQNSHNGEITPPQDAASHTFSSKTMTTN